MIDRLYQHGWFCALLDVVEDLAGTLLSVGAFVAFCLIAPLVLGALLALVFG